MKSFHGYISLASFPGPAQLSVACSRTRGEPGNEASVSSELHKLIGRVLVVID